MLVINSNKNQFTINDMLGEPEYPNFNQILALGKASHRVNSGHGTQSSPSQTTITPSNMPHTTVNGVDINNFAPKIYKEQTNFGNLTEYDITQMPRFDIMCIDDRGTSGASWIPSRNINVTYNIGISGLPVGAIVGEKCYGQLGIMTYGPNGLYLKSVESVKVYIKAYHNDNTSTDIGTITMTGNTGTGRSQTRTSLCIYSGQVETAGYTIVDGDIIVLSIEVANAKFESSSGGGLNLFGITFGGVYNYDYGAPDGFRPFQVSIRGA